MKRIGLTGSIGAGKSAAVNYFRARGIAVHDADAAVREIYTRHDVMDWMRVHFPAAVKNNSLDRAALAAIIFSDPVQKKKLEMFIHPQVKQHRDNFRHDGDMAIFDMPLLYETGAANEFDAVWLITAPHALRLTRALNRAGMTPEKFAAIDGAQMPEAEKRQHADVIIENNGTLEKLHEQLSWLIGSK
jgi:dephospho-CoA kinase